MPPPEAPSHHPAHPAPPAASAHPPPAPDKAPRPDHSGSAATRQSPYAASWGLFPLAPSPPAPVDRATALAVAPQSSFASWAQLFSASYPPPAAAPASSSAALQAAALSSPPPPAPAPARSTPPPASIAADSKPAR